MKLSFATLGCPEWTIDEICEYGSRYGYDGVGIRGILGEFDLTKIEAFSETNRKGTLEKFRRAGLDIVILSTSVKFNSPDKSEREKNLQDGIAHTDLAAAMGVDKIRVYGGPIPESVDRETAHGWVVEGFKKLCDHGGRKGVYVAIETHDDYTSTSVVKEIVERVDNEYMRVLWDVHHPFRMRGESMQESWNNIGRYVVHTHFKDSYRSDEEKLGYKYTFLGEGDVPNLQAIQLLKDGGYDGFLSLEWEKAWHDYLPDAHVAFPKFVEKMREYLSQLK
jgi:sugar phosphate isomerase/epimerase